MKKFSAIVTRTYEYEIEVDETIWDEAAIKDWAKSFYPATNQEDIAKHLAESIMRLGSNYGFMEGFGYVKKLRSDGTQMRDHADGFKIVDDHAITQGLVVKLVTEDEDYDIDLTERK